VGEIERPAGAAECLRFPCEFPLKVIGRNGAAFEQAVRDIVGLRLGGEPVAYASRPSGGGKYLSITATFTAASREQLDGIYRELHGHELVVMTL